MRKPSRIGSDKLSALIAEIEAEAYARGRADARKELLDVLGAGGVRAPRTKVSRGRRAKTDAAPKRRASGRKRAPKGSVPRLVEQALRETPGLTPPEILARAATDMERLIKLPSIRTELRNGRGQGRYELSGGRWFLAASGAGGAGLAETTSPEAAQASDPAEEENKGTLGLNL
ncbi:MAG: hypothetical protein OYH76_22710 [Defluviicoccus sp.]|nr:hypothetical protein [Defluviicoccus sp.]MDE0278717.1 hypothetical protein [Defluviicoccus sp.]